MSGIRDAARKLCETYLPETDSRAGFAHWGQIGFDHIAKDYGQGSGTSCGFLPHWLLWRLGCRDDTLASRSAPDEGLTYKIGQNLSIFLPLGKRQRPAWVSLDTEARTRDAATGKGGPACGDFVIIRGKHWKNRTTGVRDLDSSHIFVLLDVVKADGKKVVWRVAQTGASNDAGKQAGHITTLTGEVREGDVDEGAEGQTHKGPNIVFTTSILNEEANFPRRVIGYNSLEAVGFGAVPDLAFTGLFDARRGNTAVNEAAKIVEWLGWYRLEPAGGGFVPLHPTYVLLERGHEACRLERGALGQHACVAGGLWTREGSTLTITWDDGRPAQSWVVTKSWVPRETTEGAPLSGNAGKLTRLPKPPPELPPRWLMA